MKKRILFMMLLSAALTASFAQGIKKQPVKTKETAPAAQLDSVVLKGTFKNDTAKVVAVQFVEDGSLLWVKAYLVTRYFVVNNTTPQKAAEVVFNEKFQPLKPEDIYDIRPLSWK